MAHHFQRFNILTALAFLLVLPGQAVLNNSAPPVEVSTYPW